MPIEPMIAPIQRFAFRISALAGFLAWPGASDAAPDLPAPASQPPAVVSDWIAHNTNIPVASVQVVSVGDEYIVAVLSSRALDPANPRLLRLEMRAEMTDPDSQTANILRSLAATVDVNCADHTARFVQVRTFTGPNLTGSRVDQQSGRRLGGRSTHGSYLEDIETAVCNPNTPRPLQAAQGVAERQKPPLALRPSQSGRCAAASPRAGHPPDSKSSPVQASRDHADHKQPWRSGAQAQIDAAPSQAQAEAALSALRADQPTADDGPVDPGQNASSGTARLFYRALVSGFTPPASATAGFAANLAPRRDGPLHPALNGDPILTFRQQTAELGAPLAV